MCMEVPWSSSLGTYPAQLAYQEVLDKYLVYVSIEMCVPLAVGPLYVLTLSIPSINAVVHVEAAFLSREDDPYSWSRDLYKWGLSIDLWISLLSTYYDCFI